MSTGLVQRSSSDENASINMKNSKNKPKPLQASTNIIHTKIPRRIDNLIHGKTNRGQLKQVDDPTQIDKSNTIRTNRLQPANKTPKVDENSSEGAQCSTYKKTATTKKTPIVAAATTTTDENDVEAMVKNAYDSLKDVYAFDEDLYQKVLNLELADDGIPTFNSDEPFDF